MSARTAAWVGGGDLDAKNVQNWSDRGLVSFKSEKIKTNHRRLYSLKSALEICAIHQMSANGGEIGTAKSLARFLVKRLREQIESKADIHNPFSWEWLGYRVYNRDDVTIVTGKFLPAETSIDEAGTKISQHAGYGLEYCLFPADEAISVVVQRYEDKEASELNRLDKGR